MRYLELETEGRLSARRTCIESFFIEGEGTQQRGLRLTVLLTSVVLLGYRLQKGGNMCYNCGCGIPNDPRNITNKTFEEAAKAASQSPEETKRNTLALLKKVLKEDFVEDEK